MRKGEISQSELIYSILAALVLVLVIWGAYSYFTGSALPFVKFLPDFGENKSVATNVEILRYSILGDRVEYYDGTTWHSFKDTVDFGNKKVQYNSAYNSFTGYYYSQPLPATLAVPSTNVQVSAFEKGPHTYEKENSWSTLSMRSYLRIQAGSSRYILNYDNSLYALASSSTEEKAGTLSARGSTRSDGTVIFVIDYKSAGFTKGPELQTHLRALQGAILTNIHAVPETVSLNNGYELRRISGDDRANPGQAFHVRYKAYYQGAALPIETDISFQKGTDRANVFSKGTVYTYPEFRNSYKLVSKPTSAQREIVNAANNWKNGLFARPLVLQYTSLEGGSHVAREVSVCPERVRTDIVANLAKPSDNCGVSA